MKTGTCSKCKKTKDFSEFHYQDNCLGRRSWCKSCISVNLFLKKQNKYKEKYDDGDTKIDLCDCGNYYCNEIHHPKYKEGYTLKTRCPSCDHHDPEFSHTKKNKNINNFYFLKQLQLAQASERTQDETQLPS